MGILVISHYKSTFQINIPNIFTTAKVLLNIINPNKKNMHKHLTYSKSTFPKNAYTKAKKSTFFVSRSKQALMGGDIVFLPSMIWEFIYSV